MPKDSVANKWIGVSLISMATLYLLTISMNVSLRDYNDDAFYLSAFESDEFISFLSHQYQTWSGRVLVDALMISTIGYRTFWLFGIPASLLLLAYSCCKMTSSRTGLIPIALFVILFASMPVQVINDSVFWVTGFYNYLLPTSVAFYVFSVFLSGIDSKAHKIISIVLAFYISYMEQAALCFLVAMALAFVFKRDYITKFSVLLFVIVLVNFIICIKSPGSEQRLYLETWNRLPQFKYYNVFIKFSLGLDKINELIIYVVNLPLIIFCILLSYYRLTIGKLSISVKFSIVFSFAYAILQLIRLLSPAMNSHFFFNLGDISGETFFTLYKYMSYVLLTMLLTCLVTIMLDLTYHDHSFLIPIVALLVGVISVTAMGFSPTVFISGFRVDFIFEVICSFMSIFVVNKILK
ncbi:TPA: DUF6056 family protein [Enterobacter cloacae]|uniref:DUF6056 family protein n=1 Tax=Enterobacter cloacae TaxID=550 RepID=UPI001377A6FF|nr:DUF6056 family protein [Enterobacter cloacae]ELG6440382.1 hypothetical protein [Enterobacter cloacae]NBF99995.1 hypothetical protein [Enterobacter cloacae]